MYETIMSISSSSRRPKWHHPPPPPTPRILHFPRRPRRRPPARPHASAPKPATLETLFGREERVACTPPIVVFGRDSTDTRRRRTGGGAVEEEEKWKFQAEMLRAECNLLRMEKEIAVKKLDRARSKMEATLRSALHTLVSGRIKICEGKNIDMVLDEEIRELTEKLQKLQKRTGAKDSSKGTSRKNNRNFDKQVSVLQRRLEKIGGSSDEIYLREFQEMEKVTLSIKTSSRFDDTVVARGKLNVEILRRKMEGLSKGVLLQRMEEEYNSLLSTASSASNSKRIEFQDSSSFAARVPHQEKASGEGSRCSGHCKTIVRRIVEQVRAETEQWSQMQEMLGQVREEMEELQASRDFWEDRARHSDSQIQALNNSVEEWRQRALSSECKTNELEEKISVLSGDLERLRKERNAVLVNKCSPIPLDTQNELEKRVVVCCSKENSHATENSKHGEILGSCERRAHGARGGVLAVKRSPFQDIGNSSLLARRQNGKAVLPLHCHLSSNAEKIF